MSYTYEQLEHFAGCVNLILGGKRQTIEEMVRKISELKADKDYYTEWDDLARDVEDLAEYAGVDISDCESPNEVCALVLAEMKKRLKVEPDTWERIEDDCTRDPRSWCAERMCGAAQMDDSECTEAWAKDLVRRAKALAERGAE